MATESTTSLDNSAPVSHLPFLDAIRGIAILWVFTFHAMGSAYGWDHFAWKGWVRDFNEPGIPLFLFPLNFGPMGVAIFFVVSGFCIHLSHSRARTTGWQYFFHRRFFRIYPAYLLALLVFLFLWPWNHFTPQTIIRQFFIHGFAIHNLELNSKYAVNPSFWSIATEIQLYIIYPALLLLTGILGWKRTLLGILAIEILLRSLNGESSSSWLLFDLVNSPLGYWFSWAIGAYLAELFLDGKINIFSRVNFPLLLALCMATLLLKPLFNFAFTAFAFLTAVVIDRLMSKIWTFALPSKSISNGLWRHLSFLGMVSYSFYLLHQPILTNVPKFILSHVGYEPSEAMLMRTGLCLYPLILLLSWIFYKLIEMPSIAVGNKIWKISHSKT